MGEVDALAKKLNAEVLPADATSVEDLEMVFSKSSRNTGRKIDFVLHSIGMSPECAQKRTYDDLDYDMLGKTLDIRRLFPQDAPGSQKQDAIADCGSVLAFIVCGSTAYFLRLQRHGGCQEPAGIDCTQLRLYLRTRKGTYQYDLSVADPDNSR